jgi:hypothetical protein
MVKAHYNDKRFDAAVHLSDEEATMLRVFHFTEMEKLNPKIAKLIDKADGSTKYDAQISDLRSTYEYHRSSYDEACRIIRYYAAIKKPYILSNLEDDAYLKS